jgi:hypothetical protein
MQVEQPLEPWALTRSSRRWWIGPGNEGPGYCPANGSHTNVNPYTGEVSAVYRVEDSSVLGGQPNWRWCPKCHGLRFTARATYNATTNKGESALSNQCSGDGGRPLHYSWYHNYQVRQY